MINNIWQAILDRISSKVFYYPPPDIKERRLSILHHDKPIFEVKDNKGHIEIIIGKKVLPEGYKDCFESYDDYMLRLNPGFPTAQLMPLAKEIGDKLNSLVSPEIITIKPSISSSNIIIQYHLIWTTWHRENSSSGRLFMASYFQQTTNRM